MSLIDFLLRRKRDPGTEASAAGVLPPQGCRFAEVDFGTAHYAVAVPEEAEDPIARELATGRCPQSPTLELFRGLLRPGARVLDIGAHLGTFSLTAAAAGCEVVAIEASPRNASCLRATAERNRLARLQVVEAAAAAEAGWLTFNEHGPWGSVATLHGCSKLRVEAAAIDDIVVGVGWAGVDLVKLDVEGSEVAAIRGMARHLADEAAPLTLYEANSVALENTSNSSARELHQAFAEHGYRSFRVEDCGLVPHGARDPEVEAFGDFLAIKGALPGPLGRRVRPARSLDELVEWIERASRSPGIDNRIHLYRELSRSPELATLPGVARVLAGLASDPSPEVRHALLRLAPSEAAAEWLEFSVPPRMRVGELVKVLQRIRNTSAGPWPDEATAEGSIGAVFSSVRWVRPDETLVAYGDMTPLGRSVQPGEVIAVAATVRAPHEPGDYQVQLALVQAGVRWFPANAPTVPVVVE